MLSIIRDDGQVENKEKPRTNILAASLSVRKGALRFRTVPIAVRHPGFAHRLLNVETVGSSHEFESHAWRFDQILSFPSNAASDSLGAVKPRRSSFSCCKLPRPGPAGDDFRRLPFGMRFPLNALWVDALLRLVWKNSCALGSPYSFWARKCRAVTGDLKEPLSGPTIWTSSIATRTTPIHIRSISDSNSQNTIAAVGAQRIWQKPHPIRQRV